MKYRSQTGFAAIRSMEPDENLKKIGESASLPLDTAVADLPEVKGTENAKYVHVGAPLGVIVSASDLGRTVSDILSSPGVSLGSSETVVGTNENCSMDYMRSTLRQLQPESCGRCVLCRLAIDQLVRIFDDAVSGKGHADDLQTVKTIAASMRQSAFCRFGKAVGALVESYAAAFAGEFDDHAKRKKCNAMVCKKYLSYHILGSKCTGCGECLDVCDEDAITGKSKYIHMIDDYDCTRCGKCMEVCEEGAIVTAGSIKPKTPEKLTRVGAWKGR